MTDKGSAQKMTARHVMFAVACGVLMGVGAGMLFNAAGVFYPRVAEEFGVGSGQVGLWLTIVFFVTTVILPFCGRLLEKGNARVIYSICALALPVAFGLNAMAPGIWMFYIAGVIAAIPSAFILYLIPALVSRWFQKKLGFITGLISSLSGIGAMAWNMIAAGIIEGSGWRMGYVFYALATLITCLPLAVLFIRSRPEDVGLLPYGYSAESADMDTAEAVEQHRLATKGASYKDVLRSPAFYFFAIMGFCGGIFAGMNQFIPTYAISVGQAATIGAAMTSATMLSNLLGKIAFASLTDRTPLGSVLCGAGIPAIALVILLFFAGPASPMWLFILAASSTASAIRTPFSSSRCASVRRSATRTTPASGAASPR